MTHQIRLFLLAEAAAFLAAALTHLGVLVRGYEHREAATAESVIGAVLLAGFALTWVLPARTRAIGTATQGFALMGTYIGAFVAVIGVGPSTPPDIAFHVGMLLALFWVYDSSPGRERTLRLLDRGLKLLALALPLVKLPLLRKPLRELLELIGEVRA